jgi:hypothetical protein
MKWLIQVCITGNSIYSQNSFTSAAIKPDVTHIEPLIQNLPAGFKEAKRRSVKLATVTTMKQKHYIISGQFNHDILMVLRLPLDWVGANQLIRKWKFGIRQSIRQQQTCISINLLYFCLSSQPHSKDTMYWYNILYIFNIYILIS